jgi:4-amino-4-deoxy-L-arabinose transferase-like glycosyltransferase
MEAGRSSGLIGGAAPSDSAPVFTRRSAAFTSARLRLGSRAHLPSWTPSAWGAIGVAGIFIGLTWWWLTQDRSVPVYDAGTHLATAIEFHKMLQSGDLLGPFNQVSQYPPLAHLVGAIAMFIGGVNVTVPIVGENIVFVSLLALGCYQTGRLLYGPGAGLLATIFVLGSPLLIAQFHVFMLDAPETALVAVSIWLLLASKDFSRRRIAAFAGLAFGCGLLVKVQFPFFVAGIILVALVRGRWRNWQGVAVFAAVALLVGAPWYVDHISELSTISKLAGTSSGAIAGNLPPTVSSANLTWYLWSIINSQLLAPLFLLVLGGTAWTVHALLRRSDVRVLRLEFVVGAFVAWLAVTLTPHHDIRYDMPLMPYLAVIGTGWIIFLPRAARFAAASLVVLAVAANTAGITFGVGKTVEVKLVRHPPSTQQGPDRVVVYSTAGFLVAKPERDGDVPGLLQLLHRHGVQVVVWSIAQSQLPDFSFEGLIPLVEIAKLTPAITESTEFSRSSATATLIHEATTARTAPACTTLSDGTGVWAVRYDASAQKLAYYCPTRSPGYYAVGALG